jgi:1,4-alpha-glucan branching enzyme
MLTKMPGDDWQRFANLRALYSYMYTHPGKKLLFMGGEFGQWHEWDHDHSLDWHLAEWDPHRQLQRFVADLNRLYRQEPAMHEVDFSWKGFDWINFRDVDKSIIAFERRANDVNDRLIVVCNFTPVPREGYRVGVPLAGDYREVLNSDSNLYGGSNVGNQGLTPSDPVAWDGRQNSILITLPPLGVVIFKAPQPE